MALVTSQQFQAPSILQGVQQGLVNRGEIQRQGILTREEENRQRLAQIEAEQGASQLATRQRALGVPEVAPDDETEKDARMRAFADNPAAGKQILDAIGVRTQEQKEDVAAFASSALQAPDEETIQFLIDERVRKVNARGGDASETLLLKGLDPTKRTAALQALEAAALTAAQRESGALTREQISARKETEKPGGVSPVQSSRILDDGTVEIVRKNGDIEVKSPDSEAKELVKQAQVFGASLQGLRAGERDAGKAAIAQSIDAFKKLAPIKKNIKNLNEGIRLIDEGAQSGVIAKRFPSIKAASLELENLQGRLGLDIIADVTFGALSESELAFAKDTALPIGLEGEPLKDWLSRKRDAQKVLAETLTEAALFLGDPGNSVPDYIRMKRSQEQPTSQPVAALPQGVTEEDISETMRANNMTREQVLERLGGQ